MSHDFVRKIKYDIGGAGNNKKHMPGLVYDDLLYKNAY